MDLTLEWHEKGLFIDREIRMDYSGGIIESGSDVSILIAILNRWAEDKIR